MMKEWLNGLFKKDPPSPSYPDLPECSDVGESTVRGLYLVGDAAGRPLIKVGLNDGCDLGDHLAGCLSDRGVHGAEYDVVVVGCGVAGAATAVRLREKGRSVLVLEAGMTFQTLRTFTRGKLMLAEPESLPLKGALPYVESSIEETLDSLESAFRKSGVSVMEYTRVTDVRKETDGFRVVTDSGEYTAAYVVLSIGKAGNPRKAGVPGEREFPGKIHHFLSDPADFAGQNILIYGGGDVAAEAALALCDRNRVTLAAIDETFVFPKKKNVDALRDKEREGRLAIRLGTGLSAVREDSVDLTDRRTKETTSLPNNVVFEMIGAEAPKAFFAKTGVRLRGAWPWSRIFLMISAVAFCFLMYSWKRGSWPFHGYAQGISGFPGILANPSFWYSGLYTVLMVVFGAMAMKRWSKGWTDRYQIARFASLILFQVLSFVGIECVLAVYLPADTWWRAYAINNPFPLMFDSFYHLSGVSPRELKWIIAFVGFLITFVVIPVAVRYHGKRFCSWVCGCGGLAETFGDRWRHLAPKGERSRRWEFMGTVVMFWAFVSAGVILWGYHGNSGSSGMWHSTYELVVGFWLISIIPVGVYPVLGGKIWCRYWCPLAKYMELLSHWYGRLAIVSNDKCIQCTQCSLYCQVGVDVMAFARNGEAFSNTNSSCIHCGICITVCPMDVLSFKQLP